MKSELLHPYNQSNFSVVIACKQPTSKIMKWHLISVEWVKKISHMKLVQGPRSRLQATVPLFAVPGQSWRWRWKLHSATLKFSHQSTNFVSILRFLSFCMSLINLYFIDSPPPPKKKNTTGKINYIFWQKWKACRNQLMCFQLN